MNVNELIPGHIYYVHLKDNRFIFQYVKRANLSKDIIVCERRYFDLNLNIIVSSSYADEDNLCRLFRTTSKIFELREATPEEAKLLGVENYCTKLKINHKQFKLKFTL